MNRPTLTYVDNTILTALFSAGPVGETVRHWLGHCADAWVSSEIALTRTLQKLETLGVIPAAPLDSHEALLAVLRTLNASIAIRPLPWRALTAQPFHTTRPMGWSNRPTPTLTAADLIELAAARLWRCPCLISNNPDLRQAAQAWGLVSLGIGAPPAPPAMGDWRGRSPTTP